MGNYPRSKEKVQTNYSSLKPKQFFIMSKHLQNTLTYLSVKEKGGEREKKKKRDVFKDDIIQQR